MDRTCAPKGDKVHLESPVNENTAIVFRIGMVTEKS